MANNDMSVIIYKILAYLYDSLKAGANPEFSDIQYNSSLLGIPRKYWNAVIEELVDEKLIKGVKTYHTKDGPVYCDNGISITLKGVEYLEENSIMKKAKDFLGESFQSVLNGLVSGLASRTPV